MYPDLFVKPRDANLGRDRPSLDMGSEVDEYEDDEYEDDFGGEASEVTAAANYENAAAAAESSDFVLFRQRRFGDIDARK